MAIKFSTRYQDEPKEKEKKVKIGGGRMTSSKIKTAKAPKVIKPLKLSSSKKKEY